MSEVSAVEAAMYHTCAIDKQGQLWCWGGNQSGQLGDGTTAPSAVPKKVEGPESGWGAITELGLGQHQTCAVNSEGEAFCWGADWYGGLGRGLMSEDLIKTPERAAALPAGVRRIAAGELHACAVIDDGTVVCVGSNDEGEVGNGEVGLGGVVTPAEVEICESELTESATCPE
jgi:alpha-tubulin suppressor-like RCC1 family protein